MRGSISQLRDAGFILGEDGCEVYFDLCEIGGADIARISVGRWVEYDLQAGPDRLRATNIRVLNLCSHRRKPLFQAPLL